MPVISFLEQKGKYIKEEMITEAVKTAAKYYIWAKYKHQ